ncbi:MAG: 2,3-bisphosphoglycerate-independent phosphoglycerate mutase, partial [Acidimicrobiia bacterium]
SELGGRTPLEAAVTPHFAALAARSEVGRAATIPLGYPPGSDVGNMSILGYDPARFHTGRAPIEAAAMGVELGDDEVAFRCNLVTVDESSSTMVDFAAGHVATDIAAEIIGAVDEALGAGRDGIRFVPGVMYRHVMVAPKSLAEADCVPPHDLIGQQARPPTGPAAGRLLDLMEASRAVVAERAAALGSVATQIWLWGQGSRPRLPNFTQTFGVAARLVSAVDLVRGLGVLTGIDPVFVAGATGYYDTDYAAKRDACLKSLEDRDLFVLHIEATDEAGHNGEVERKVEALERWDSLVIGPLLEALPALGPHRILLVPDHATPCALRTHTADPVPYLLFDSSVERRGCSWTERATAGLAPVPGHELMQRLLCRPAG